MADVFFAPVLHTIGEGVVVQTPGAPTAAPDGIGPNGGFSIGADYIDDVGAVVHIALHNPDGTTLVMTMGSKGFNAFGRLFNDAGEAIARGDFRKPETKQ